MKVFGILISAVFIFYLLFNFVDLTPDFEDEFEHVRLDDVSITHQQSTLQITNVSSDRLDQVTVEYTVIATSDARSDREIVFELPQDSILHPDDTITLRSTGAQSPDGQRIHYKLDSVDYRVAPF